MSAKSKPRLQRLFLTSDEGGQHTFLPYGIQVELKNRESLDAGITASIKGSGAMVNPQRKWQELPNSPMGACKEWAG